MNRRTRRFGGVVLLGAATLALAGCGSDDGPVAAAPAPATTPTTPSSSVPADTSAVTGDDPAADAMQDAADEPTVPDVYADLRTAMHGYDALAEQLPPALQTQYADLKAEVDHASGLSGDAAVEGYANVKTGIDDFEQALHDLTSDDVDQSVIDGWSTVKAEFDQIDAGF